MLTISLLLASQVFAAPERGPDYTTLFDAGDHCAWVRNTAGKQHTLAQLPAACTQVRKISLNRAADSALVVLGATTDSALPRFFQLDLKDPNAVLQPLPPLVNKSEAWFDLLYDRKQQQQPIAFTIAPAKPEDRNSVRNEPTLHIYTLKAEAWSLTKEIYPELQTDDNPGPATEAYWQAGFAYSTFDPTQGEEKGPRAPFREQLKALCRDAGGALWNASNTIGLCWSYPEGGEGWSHFTGRGGMIGGPKTLKAFEVPQLAQWSVGNAGRVQAQGSYLLLCGLRRIWDLSTNHTAVDVEGKYAVALWPHNLDPSCRTEPEFSL